jgi:TRAP-type C4-dicarboxylate transport system permease small subunit
MIYTLDRIPNLLSLALKYAAAALLLGVAVLITLDVTMRFFFNSPIIGVAEIVSNEVVMIAFLQLGYAVRVRGMLRSELLISFLGRRGRIAMETL